MREPGVFVFNSALPGRQVSTESILCCFEMEDRKKGSACQSCYKLLLIIYQIPLLPLTIHTTLGKMRTYYICLIEICRVLGPVLLGNTTPENTHCVMYNWWQ